MTTKPKQYLTREQAWMRLCHAFCEAAATENMAIRDSRFSPQTRCSMGCCPAITNLGDVTTEETRSEMRADLASFKTEAVSLDAIVNHTGAPDPYGLFVWPVDPEGHSARAFACWLMAQPDYPR